MESRRVSRPCRSFAFDKAHTNSSAIYPDDLRTLICSTRGHVLDATMYSTRSGNAPFDPALAGTIAIMAVVKKIGAGIGARIHGMNILKSRRRVWNLRRGRPRGICFTGERCVPE